MESKPRDQVLTFSFRRSSQAPSLVLVPIVSVAVSVFPRVLQGESFLFPLSLARTNLLIADLILSKSEEVREREREELVDYNLQKVTSPTETDCCCCCCFCSSYFSF